MEKKQKIILIAIAFALVLLCSGLTYAFFTSATPGESASTIVAKGGQMNVVYDNKSANISVSNIYPRDTAWVTKKFQVIGNNSTDLLMFYKVKLVVDINEFELDLSYTLTGTNTANSGGLIPDVTTVPRDAHIGSDTVTLGTGYHVKGTSNVHEYTLQIFLKPTKYDQNYGQEAKFAAHLVIEIDGTSTEKAPKNWDSAGSNTLLAGIKKNYPSPTTTLTNPITSASASNEAVMSLTPDDYGISYYFRGAVQNNFVSFAGMCWRIVRITGDGSIKLVLYDYMTSNCAHTDSTMAYARYDGDIYTTKFNENNDDNAYGGFMYGTPNSNTYAATHTNKNKSTILQNLETWYKAKLTSYASDLADTIWCNDKSTVKDVKYTNYKIENDVLNKDSLILNGLGYKQENSMYSPFARISGFNIGDVYTLGAGPSLICPKDNNGGKLSKFTVDDTVNGNGDLDYKIGLLTADEIILAGVATFSLSYSYVVPVADSVYEDNFYYVTSYLRGNAQEVDWWSLSPVGYAGSFVILMVDGNGIFLSNRTINSYALRPAISLKATTTISSGNGTASNPFIITGSPYDPKVPVY